eukprot:6411061-Pyramimonas_sp.AAC.1
MFAPKCHPHQDGRHRLHPLDRHRLHVGEVSLAQSVAAVGGGPRVAERTGALGHRRLGPARRGLQWLGPRPRATAATSISAASPISAPSR